jgi:hypothetical protein
VYLWSPGGSGRRLEAATEDGGLPPSFGGERGVRPADEPARAIALLLSVTNREQRYHDRDGRLTARESTRMRRVVVGVGIVVLLVSWTFPAGGQVDAAGCSGRYGEVFGTRAEAGPVAVVGSGLSEELTERFADDFRPIAELLDAEIVSLDGVEVCIFDDRIPEDAQALGWPEGQLLRAVAFGEDRLVVLSSWLIGRVADAGRIGLIHIALWQVSDGEYPQPFGNDVMGWYRARLDGTLDAIHRLFLRQQIGLTEPWPPTRWTDWETDDPILWNPERSYGGAGDFTDFVVEREGLEFLADPDPAEIARLDEAWRQTLFDESGAIPGGSRGWITGVILITAILAAAIALGVADRVYRKRGERRIREEALNPQRVWPAEEPEEGEEAGVLVRPSVGSGRRRGDTRVGGSQARPRGVKGDDRDRSPSGGQVRPERDPVPPADESGHDLFRHPGLDDDGRS